MHIISSRVNLQAHNNSTVFLLWGYERRWSMIEPHVSPFWPETSVYKAPVILQIPRLASDQEITAIPPRRAGVWAQIAARVRPPRPLSSALERLISAVMRDTPGSVLSAPLTFMLSSVPLTGSDALRWSSGFIAALAQQEHMLNPSHRPNTHCIRCKYFL